MLTADGGVATTSTALVPFAPSAVAAARRTLTADLLARGLDRTAVEDAVLVLSEILSNALRHARPLPSGRVQVRWSLRRGAVELEVTDGGSPTRPRAAPASRSATGGRGLAIVDDLARDWGVQQEDARTTVWAVLPGRRTLDLRR